MTTVVVSFDANFKHIECGAALDDGMEAAACAKCCCLPLGEYLEDGYMLY